MIDIKLEANFFVIKVTEELTETDVSKVIQQLRDLCTSNKKFIVLTDLSTDPKTPITAVVHFSNQLRPLSRQLELFWLRNAILVKSGLSAFILSVLRLALKTNIKVFSDERQAWKWCADGFKEASLPMPTKLMSSNIPIK